MLFLEAQSETTRHLNKNNFTIAHKQKERGSRAAPNKQQQLQQSKSGETLTKNKNSNNIFIGKKCNLPCGLDCSFLSLSLSQ